MDRFGAWLYIAGFSATGVLLLMAGLTLPAALRGKDASKRHSWLLRKLGPSAEIVAGTIVWGLAGIGFLVAGAGLGLQQVWWVWGAWMGAPLAIAAIALWFGSIPPGAYVLGVFAALTLGTLVYGALR